jgi:maltose alpha-D-glucosyltransferase/alpha-amylase
VNDGWPQEPHAQWYKDAIIYELHVRAFKDTNDDGVGDFRGLLEKLDYLQDLGVTAIWLLPFYPSPLRDDGYDISNYTDVNPLYGSLSDFTDFLQEAHRRGLRVITELVVNHTSDQHPWFQRARRARPGTPEREFYVWSDDSTKYPEARIIFKDFEGSNWTWDALAGQFYWHRFYAHQPDLNYDNPLVHQAIFEVLDFWLGLGIDGLRLDAVPYLYEREGTNCENLPETHAFLRELRRHVDEKFPNRMLLAEANQWPEDSVTYLGRSDECHMAFHFPVMPRLFMAIRMEDRLPIVDILQQTPAIPDSCQWALFLRNHDELTLEMVTDEDRDYMYRVYAQDPQARINLGIRRRLAPLLENHRGKIELMNGLLLSLPGTPVIYYGDEIGMGDNIYLGDRNGVRTPMQWSPDRNAGFSRANPQRLYLPVIIDPAYHYEAINVETQQNNPHSLLWWMKRRIALRKRFQAFGRGTLEFLQPDNHKVLAFVRRHQAECILVVANLSRFVQCVEIDLNDFKGLRPVEMLGRTKFPPVGERPYFFTLVGHAFYWFTLEAAYPALPAAEAQPETRVGAPLPTVYVRGNWEAVLHGRARVALDDLLPGYLAGCRWFQGRERQAEAAMILETIPVTDDGRIAQLALVQVEYSEGDAETYLLPLAYTSGPSAEHIAAQRPQAVVCRLQLDNSDGASSGILYDPLGEQEFSQAVLETLLHQKRLKRASGEVVVVRLSTPVPSADAEVPVPEASLIRADQSNTLIAYGDRWIVKTYRRLEEGVNPEWEINRFLAEKTAFIHMPRVAGALEYRRNWGQPIMLALLEEYLPHQEDGWRFTRDSLSRYFEQVLTRPGPPPDLPPTCISLLDLLDSPVPSLAQETIGPYLEAMRLLGQRTAEFHVALASPTEDPSFAPEPFTGLQQRSLYQSLRSQARKAFGDLRKLARTVPESLRDPVQQLLALEEQLLRRARAVMERRLTAVRIRCHGDYHLGQVLYTGRDFFLIDLEGQARRTFSDRRRKRSPLRDVASMLRSFHYAVRISLRGSPVRPQDVAALDPWARLWHLWVSVGFLKAYLEAAGRAPFLPQSRQEIDVMLDFFLVKRAVNELQHELHFARSDGIRAPVEGLLDLLVAHNGPC